MSEMTDEEANRQYEQYRTSMESVRSQIRQDLRLLPKAYRESYLGDLRYEINAELRSRGYEK